MPGPGDRGRTPYEYPAGDERSEIQRNLARNLKRVPGVGSVGFEESEIGVEYQVVGDIDTSIFASGIVETESASVTVNWWPLHDDEARHWYQFHYDEPGGFDCGWHRHENGHVDGLTHYQERESPDDEYEYYEFEPHFGNPVGLPWEIVGDRLECRLALRYDAT